MKNATSSFDLQTHLDQGVNVISFYFFFFAHLTVLGGDHV
jgi:hypothetical protein